MEVNGIIICYANFCLPNSFLRSIIMCGGKAVLCGSCHFSSSRTSVEPETRADFSGLWDGVLAWGQQAGGKNRILQKKENQSVFFLHVHLHMPVWEVWLCKWTDRLSHSLVPHQRGPWDVRIAEAVPLLQKLLETCLGVSRERAVRPKRAPTTRTARK